MRISFLVLGILSYVFSLVFLNPRYITISSSIKYIASLAFTSFLFVLALN